MTEWERAFTKAKTSQEQAELLYVRAWGRELIRVYGGFAQWNELPEQDTSLQEMTRATQLAPKNPLYWQSLGDINLGLDVGLAVGKNKNAAIAAYYQALKVKKDNANLWYRLYDLFKQDNPDKAKEALRQAARLESENAYPAYRLAGLMLYDTPFGDYDKEIKRVVKANLLITEENWNLIGKRITQSPNYAIVRQNAETAIAYVEQGNRAFNYNPPLYAPPFPRLLKAAWEYGLGGYLDNTKDIRDWHTISVSIGGYIRSVIPQGDKDAGEHAAHVLIDMGRKIVGDLDKAPMPLSLLERARLTNGFSIARTGYDWLIQAYKAAGSKENASRVETAFQEFKAYQQHYWEAYATASNNSYGNH